MSEPAGEWVIADDGLSHVKIASVQRTMGSLTAKFRD